MRDTVGGVNRTHDDNGNLLGDGTYTYYYDYRNNLVKVMSGETVIAEYEFDAMGRRVRKSTNGWSDWEESYFDGEHVVEEYDDSDALLKTFIYGQEIDEIRVMIAPDYADVDDDSDTTEVLNFYYHHNVLGSVTHVTGPNETVVEQYEYLPYGGTTIKDGSGTDLSGTSAIKNPYMFTARRFEEETGLYHYRRRAYDPDKGRFLQRDPLGYVDGPNTFEYAVSRPTSNSDPFGLSSYGPNRVPKVTLSELLSLALSMVASENPGADPLVLARLAEKKFYGLVWAARMQGILVVNEKGNPFLYEMEWDAIAKWAAKFLAKKREFWVGHLKSPTHVDPWAPEEGGLNYGRPWDRLKDGRRSHGSGGTVRAIPWDPDSGGWVIPHGHPPKDEGGVTEPGGYDLGHIWPPLSPGQHVFVVIVQRIAKSDGSVNVLLTFWLVGKRPDGTRYITPAGSVTRRYRPTK